MDRHVIANMGAELGATTTVFPADEAVRAFLRAEQRERRLHRAARRRRTRPTTSPTRSTSPTLEPLIAAPVSARATWCRCARSAGAGRSFQVVIGSSANPGLRDFADRRRDRRGTADPRRGCRFDVNPTSRQILEDLTKMGCTVRPDRRRRADPPGRCLGCIGMGQAPATGRNSLRTLPRNFPGRSGTEEDAVYLCSPGDRRRGRADRRDHRPARPGRRCSACDYPELDLPGPVST